MMKRANAQDAEHVHLERVQALWRGVGLRMDRLHALDLLQVHGASHAFSLLLSRCPNSQVASDRCSAQM